MDGPAVDPDDEFEYKVRAMDEAPVGIAISDPHREDNPLIYVNEAFERLTGFPREDVLGRNCRFLQGPGTDPDAVAEMRAAIEDERPVTVELLNYRADGERFWNEVTIAPLEDEAGAITHFVGFQADVTARKEAELELQRRRRSLERLVSRIDGLLREVTETLMRSTSREENERELVARIAAADPYVFAWFGEPDLASGTIAPSSWAGDGQSLDGIEIDIHGDDPTAQAFETRSVRTGVGIEGTACADRLSAASMAATPITYGERAYGVLTVYADDPDAFDEYETAVVAALGRTIGTAIDAAESRRVLATDGTVELRFELGDREFFLAELSSRCECRFEYRGASYRSDGSLSMFFSTDGDADAVLDRAMGMADVAEVSRLGDDGRSTLLEFRAAEGTIVADLADQSVRTRSITVENGTGRFVVETAADADPRAILERIGEKYSDVELTAYRQRVAEPTTEREFVATLEARLTDRQSTALRRAYLGGYYEPNRATSGDELAASMGISRSTFHQHLRAAEHKLLEEFFDRL